MKQSNDSIQLYNFFNKINNISKSKIDYKNIVFICNILKIIEKSYYQSKNFNNIKFQGVQFNPLKNEWKLIKSLSVNYMFSSKLK